MSKFLETLESRRFLSATTATLLADVGAIQSQSDHIKADSLGSLHQASADIKTIEGDLKRLNAGSADEGLLKTLKADSKSAFDRLNKDVKSWLSQVGKAAKVAVNDAKALAKKPGNARLTAKLSADLSRFDSVDSSGRSKVLDDTVKIDTKPIQDLTEIDNAETGDAMTQTDVSTTKATFGQVESIFQADASLLTDKISRLKTDVSS